MDGLKRGGAAIVGVAESDIGQVAEGLSVIDLMAQGTKRALDDCGLALRDVDGLFCATAQSRMSALGLAEYLGIDPRFLGSTIVGGSSFEYHVAHAMGAIALGLCEVAVIAYGSTQRSVGRKQASVREVNPYETPFKPFLPASAYALAASRHMHEFGTTREQLAAVAVAAREWALLNPVAWEKKPLTIEDVLSARMVSYPFTVRDCCIVTDGGGAIVVTSAERARSLKKKPAYVLGCGQSVTHANISSMPDLTVTGALASGKAAYAMARLGPSDVDAVEVYDAFTINTILFLEDLGFCKKGEGGAFVADGRIAPKGRLPVNTNGGGLSYCHPGMYGLLLLIEAVRQLRGECGARQVPGCDVALVHGNGGVLSSQATVILGTEATLS
jgi:acetyl-CoA acetyltransferase